MELTEVLSTYDQKRLGTLPEAWRRAIERVARELDREASKNVAVRSEYCYELLPLGDVERKDLFAVDINDETVFHRWLRRAADEENARIATGLLDEILRYKAIDMVEKHFKVGIDDVEWDDELEDIFVWVDDKKMVVADIIERWDEHYGGHGEAGMRLKLDPKEWRIIEVD